MKLKEADTPLKPRTPHTIVPVEFVTEFANALENFEPIYSQPFDTNLTQIREVVAPLLLQISYDETGGKHNPIGLIWQVTAYTTHHGTEFFKPTIIGAYYATVIDDATSVICAYT